MSIQQLDQSVNRFGTTKVGDFLNSHTSPDGSQLIDDPDIPTGTIEITENGTGIDVYNYATADIAVQTYEDELKAVIDRSVTTIDIPTGTTAIGNSAFARCTNLTTVNIPNSVTVIGAYAFVDCEYLNNVVIPDGVSIIEVDTFYGCTRMDNIILSPEIESIMANAFKNCTSLTEITLYEDVTSIGENAFNGCTSLTTINYTGTQAEWEQITIGTNAIPQGVTINYEYTPESEEVNEET